MLALVGLILVAAAAPQGNVYRPPRETAPARSRAALPDETLPDEEVHARTASFLQRLDVPVTADDWRTLGSRAVPLLEEVVVNRDALPSRRAAALAGLAAIGGARAQELLIEAARSEDEPFAVRVAAIHGASCALGSQRLVKELRPVLERSRDPSARAAAAEALTRRAPRSTCGVVRAQADREGEGRLCFEQALEPCGPR